MRLQDGELLPYLHDAVLFELRYDARIRDTRTLVITVQCHPDAGYEPWNDAILRLCAKGTFLFRCTAWGYCLGQDTVDSWQEGLSKATACELKHLEAKGLRLPGRCFTIALHSGSRIEFACEGLDIENEMPR